MNWVILVLAGLFEIGWAVGLKYTQGFTRPLPSVLTALMLFTSVGLLSVAARTLPIGTAYAVWVGIGSVGAAVLGIVLFGEPVTAPRLAFLVLMVVAIVGLKATAQP
jgi:quaternary ammonium compound-resistance protein SugE